MLERVWRKGTLLHCWSACKLIQPLWKTVCRALKKLGIKALWKKEVAQSCPTLCDSMDCSLSGSSVHGIFQARVLEWIAISFSRGFFQPRNWTRVSRIAGRCCTVWATSNPTHRHIPWGNQSWKRHMYSLFIAARYRIARTWKQPRCPLTDEWIKKFWYICTWNSTQPWIGTHLSQF